MIDTALILHTYVGDGYAGYNGDGIPATDAELYFPSMMTFDAADNLYFSDELNYRIRFVNNTEGIAGQSSPNVGFSVYPNPAHSLLNFTFPQGRASITLSDVTGRKVAGVQVGNGAAYALPVGGLLPGVYLYKITTPTQTQRGKVEVE